MMDSSKEDVDEGSPTKKKVTQEVDKDSQTKKSIKVVFIMGGPGSGKRTVCAKIEQKFGYTVLSAGELLQDEIKAGSEDGTLIQNATNEGKPVPSDVVVRVILKVMQETDNDKFLIRGFPRNEDNITTFQNLTKTEPDFVLFLDCPEEEMTKRLLSRNLDSNEDSIQTIRERFQVFQESTLPLVDYYDSKEMLRKVDASRPIDEVFDSVKSIFSSTKEDVMPLGCFNLWFLKGFGK